MQSPDAVTAMTANLRSVEPVTRLTNSPLQVQLTDIQATAKDFYERGFNPFPLPAVHEWRARADFIGNENKKPSYTHETFFYSRMHLCNAGCRHSPTPSFTDLFHRANVGLMLGRTSQNAFVIDCDNTYSFEKIHTELDQRNIPFWAWTSHRGGAFLLRCAEGEVANMPETIFSDVQVWGNKQYCVAPPSMHPLGTGYDWLTPEPKTSLPKGATLPSVSIKALDWLGVSLRKGKKADAFELPAWADVLSYKNREALALGLDDGERSIRLFAVACDMAGNEIDEQDAEQALIDAANLCRPPFPARAAVSILKGAYTKERSPAKGHYKTNQFPEWKRAEEFGLSYNWRENYGRKARGLRKTFFAMVERCKQDNSKVFRASLREVAELANTSHTRIKENLAALHELIIHKGTSGTGTGLYSFSKTVQIDNNTPPVNTVIGLAHTENEQDAFGKLGDNAFRLWRYLQISPTSTGYKMAQALNMPPSSTYKALETLRACGLVTLSEGLHYGELATDNTLGNLAAELGTNGKARTRRENHLREREIRNNKLLAKARETYNQKEGSKC